MISRQTILARFNHGDYLVSQPNPPRWGNATPAGPGDASLQVDPVRVSEDVLDQLREAAAAVHTDRESVVLGTRDWWAGTMIGETAGNPATPDAVIVEAATEDQIAAVLRICNENRIPVTPSAGRSNVTGAALPVHGGVVLDVCRLNKILSFDAESLIVEVEAGMFGDAFETELQEKYGVTTGHWPSAFAISTVGGWVACRGAGQLSTRYGKIEDMVVGLDVVLADGSLVHLQDFPRGAVGPDLRQLFVGSEGTLGVITRVRLRVHRTPAYARGIAFGFETFAAGLDACREILQRGATPAVLRLYDTTESGNHFGHPETNLLLIADEGDSRIVDAMLAVSEEVCASAGAVRLDDEKVFEDWLDDRMRLGKSAAGFKQGPGFVADTLEIAADWASLPAIYDDVVSSIEAVPGTLKASAHQSHAYTDGACVYFSLRGDVEFSRDSANGEVLVDKRREWYRAAWDAANAALIRHDSALSHHHGCGLLRGPYLKESLGSAFDVLVSVKQTLDPNGILNPSKLGLPSPFGPSPLTR